jgi:hypothetical protein
MAPAQGADANEPRKRMVVDCSVPRPTRLAEHAARLHQICCFRRRARFRLILFQSSPQLPSPGAGSALRVPGILLERPLHRRIRRPRPLAPGCFANCLEWVVRSVSRRGRVTIGGQWLGAAILLGAAAGGPLNGLAIDKDLGLLFLVFSTSCAMIPVVWRVYCSKRL